MPRQTTAKVAETVEDRPLAGYATLTSAFWAVFGGFLLAAGKRLPDRTPTGDVVRIALASYKMSRVVAKEDVAAFIRAPVTDDPEAQQPKKEGMAAVLGELVTCPYCLGLWFSSALSYAHVIVPRQARFATSIFAAYAVTDFLHAGFARVRGS
ncbi:MAG: DUF1360 domain-containing protein [Actinomycetota bacterium]|nr:DUF1360 domain-containing protein [Actinomycetota bacterium]